MALGASTKEVRRLLVSDIEDQRDARGKMLTIQQREAKQSFNEAVRNGLMCEIEVVCPVCGEQKFEEFCNIDRIGLKVQSVMCSRCPTIYSRKRFDEASLKIFYSRFYVFHKNHLEFFGFLFYNAILSGLVYFDKAIYYYL